MNKKIYTLLMLLLLLVPFTNALSLAIPYEEERYCNQGQCYTLPVFCDNANNDYQHCSTPQLDVVFVIDSTGSMADEIRSVKYQIKNIVQRVQSGTPQPKIRIGVVAYRDYSLEEEEYLTQKLRLTTDVNEALIFIEKIVANGGGDTPEAVEAGLNEGLSMRWDTDARKIIFLIGDAPPHGAGTSETSYQNGPPVNYNYKDMIQKAQEKNVRIFTISGSGMDQNGIQVWKHIAVKTGGSYTPLSYERVKVDDYFADEGIDVAYASEAAAAPDYDYATRSFKANNLADVAEQFLMQEESAAGVIYDNSVDTILIEEFPLPPEEFEEPHPVSIEPQPLPRKSSWHIFDWTFFWK